MGRKVSLDIKQTTARSNKLSAALCSQEQTFFFNFLCQENSRLINMHVCVLPESGKSSVVHIRTGLLMPSPSKHPGLS